MDSDSALHIHWQPPEAGALPSTFWNVAVYDFLGKLCRVNIRRRVGTVVNQHGSWQMLANYRKMVADLDTFGNNCSPVFLTTLGPPLLAIDVFALYIWLYMVV